MAISRVTAQEITNVLSATGTTISAVYPSTPTAGDYLFCLISVGASSTNPAITMSNSGWTLLGYKGAQGAAGGYVSHALFGKVAGASEPTTVTATWTPAEYAAILLCEYTGVDPTTPIQTSATAGNGGSTGSTAATASVTAAAACGQSGMAAVWFLSNNQTIGWTVSLTTGWTNEETAHSTGFGNCGEVTHFDNLTPAMGSTPAPSVTASVAAGTSWYGTIVLLYEAGSAPPTNTVAPAVTGTAATGSTLSCSTGTWTGDVSYGYTFQWKDDAGNIAGATGTTYVIGSGEAGHSIHCTVTATGTGGPSSADSNTVGPVSAAYTETLSNAKVDLCANTVVDIYVAGAGGAGGWLVGAIPI